MKKLVKGQKEEEEEEAEKRRINSKGEELLQAETALI